MKKYIFMAFVSSLFFACQKSETQQQLEQADSLMTHNQPQKAYTILNHIEPESIDDEDEEAYFWLLKYEAEQQLHHDIKDTYKLEDACDHFFFAFSEKEKNVRAELCLARIKALQQNINDAYFIIMETKKNIEDAKLPRKYAGQYNLQMASLYHEQQRNDTALHYARQALADFFADGNRRDVQLTRIMLFMAYADKQQADSANYYMKRAKEHINDVEEYERAPFYATLGGWIAHNDTALAKSYLVRSIDIMPNYRAYRNLATLYAKTGQQQQAIDTWKLAATTKDKMLRMNAMQQLYALQHGADDYEAACQTAMQMVNLQDSLAKEKNIDSAKQEYETSASRFKQKFFLYLSLLAMAIFSVIITILFVVMVRKYKRTSRKLSDAEKEVNRLCILLTATRQGIKDGKEADEPSAPQKDIIALNGKLLMDEICQGGTTVRWTRSDFDDAANYCHTLDADFIDCLRARNPQLSSRYIVFAYLKHIGKSDAQLRHALVISQSTIRSYRSRIKQ